MEIGGPIEKSCIVHGEADNLLGTGKNQLWWGFDIADAAALYRGANSTQLDKHMNNHWSGDSDLKTKWMRALTSVDDARAAVAQWTFPEEDRNKAYALSRRLMWVLQEEGAKRVSRRETAGRFDTRAAGRMLNSYRSGQYDMNVIRPYIKVHRDNPKRPHVGIVAGGNWSMMWGDKEYIPRVAQITSAVAWACEILGCTVTAAMGRNVNGGYYNRKSALGLLFIARPGLSIPLKAYAAMSHREMYRMAYATGLIACHPEHLKIILDLSEQEMQRKYFSGQSIDDNERATEDFNGVQFLKSQGCDITIAIGKFDDTKKADVHLDTKTKLEDAIDQIALKLGEMKRKRAA